MRRRTLIGCALLAAIVAGSAIGLRRGPATTAAGGALEDRWGVQVEGIRLSAGGYMLDFRYRIVDAEKAQAVVDRQWKPYLLDEESGARLMVPAPGKVGPLRQTMRHGPPKEGKTYFVLFANPGQMIRQGQRVSVVIGDFKAADLIVG
jgi:hypothetical protein